MVSKVHVPIGPQLGAGTRSLRGLCDSPGFTLVESMAAAVILAVGLLAIAGMQGISLGRNIDSNELSRATNLATDIIERIQFNRRNAIQYNNIDTTAATPCPSTNTMALGDCNQWRDLLNGSGLNAIRGTVTATAIVTTPPLNQTQVTVTLTWTGSINAEGSVRRTRTITMSSIIAPE